MSTKNIIVVGDGPAPNFHLTSCFLCDLTFNLDDTTAVIATDYDSCGDTTSPSPSSSSSSFYHVSFLLFLLLLLLLMMMILPSPPLLDLFLLSWSYHCYVWHLCDSHYFQLSFLSLHQLYLLLFLPSNIFYNTWSWWWLRWSIIWVNTSILLFL